LLLGGVLYFIGLLNPSGTALRFITCRRYVVSGSGLTKSHAWGARADHDGWLDGAAKGDFSSVGEQERAALGIDCVMSFETRLLKEEGRNVDEATLFVAAEGYRTMSSPPLRFRKCLVIVHLIIAD